MSDRKKSGFTEEQIIGFLRHAEASIETAASSCDDGYDSALNEPINGLREAELIHRWPELREVTSSISPHLKRLPVRFMPTSLL